MPGTKQTFATCQWGGDTMGPRIKYGAAQVNAWAEMVDEKTEGPCEFIVVTDSPEGIDGGIRTVEMWPDLARYGRCYRRLKLFSEEMADLIAPRFVAMDLDILPVGKLDPLFDHDEPFKIWADPIGPVPYCGSLWQMDAGRFPHVFDDFDILEAKRLNKQGWHGSDQAWISKMLPERPTWTQEDGVLSFRMDVMRGGFNPLDGRLIVFHGVLDPSVPEVQEKFPWVARHYPI